MRHLAAWFGLFWRAVWKRLVKVPRNVRVVSAIVAVSAFCGAGLVAFAPEPDRMAVEDAGVPVSSMLAEVRTLAPEVRLYGRVETPNAAKLNALVGAPVTTLAVRVGERVEAGAALIGLDETDLALAETRAEADLVQAQADLDVLLLGGDEDRAVLTYQEQLAASAKAKADWHRELFQQGSISRQTLNAALSESHAQAIALVQQRGVVASFEHRRARAEANVERAKAGREEARVNRQRTVVRAPFPGRVTRIMVAPGELVAPGTVVAEMYDDSRLEIRAHIPNVHLPVVEAALAAGERPRVVADFGDFRAPGMLERLVGAVEEGRSGVDGIVALEGTANPPDLGRAVQLRMTLLPVADVVAVPVQAVYGQRRLFLIEEGLLTGIDVERIGEITTPAGDLKLLVRAQRLTQGASVLTSQLSNAVTGLRVSDQHPEGAAHPGAPRTVDLAAL